MSKKLLLGSLATLCCFSVACSDDSAEYFDSSKNGEVVESMTRIPSTNEMVVSFESKKYPYCLDANLVNSGDPTNWSSLSSKSCNDSCDEATYKSGCSDDLTYYSECQNGVIKSNFIGCIEPKQNRSDPNNMNFDLVRSGECRSYKLDNKTQFDCLMYGITELCDKEGDTRTVTVSEETTYKVDYICVKTNMDELIWVRK